MSSPKCPGCMPSASDRKSAETCAAPICSTWGRLTRVSVLGAVSTWPTRRQAENAPSFRECYGSFFALATFDSVSLHYPTTILPQLRICCLKLLCPLPVQCSRHLSDRQLTHFEEDKMTQNTLLLPALRAKMGDWTYYIASMTLADLVRRVTTASAVHQSRKLDDLIQRSLSPRAGDIAEYLLSQPQRLFGTLVVGVYGGEPRWLEVEIREDVQLLNDSDGHLVGTIGLLRLSGTEQLYALDGQHRLVGTAEGAREGPDSWQRRGRRHLRGAHQRPNRFGEDSSAVQYAEPIREAGVKKRHHRAGRGRRSSHRNASGAGRPSTV